MTAISLSDVMTSLSLYSNQMFFLDLLLPLVLLIKSWSRISPSPSQIYTGNRQKKDKDNIFWDFLEWFPTCFLRRVLALKLDDTETSQKGREWRVPPQTWFPTEECYSQEMLVPPNLTHICIHTCCSSEKPTVLLGIFLVFWHSIWGGRALFSRIPIQHEQEISRFGLNHQQLFRPLPQINLPRTIKKQTHKTTKI